MATGGTTTTGGALGTGSLPGGATTCSPTIYITSPMAGEVWFQGVTYWPSWTSICVTGKIRLVMVQGSREVPPTISTTASPNGTVAVQVPASWAPGTGYQFCATANDGLVAACSPIFTVAPAPNAGTGGVVGTGGVAGTGGIMATGGTTTTGGALGTGDTPFGLGGSTLSTASNLGGAGGTTTASSSTAATWLCDGKQNYLDGVALMSQTSPTSSGAYASSIYTLGAPVGPSDPDTNFPDQLASGYLSRLPAGRIAVCADYEITSSAGLVPVELKLVSAPPSGWSTIVSAVETVMPMRKVVCVPGVVSQDFAGWQYALQIWSAGTYYRLHRAAVCPQ